MNFNSIKNLINNNKIILIVIWLLVQSALLFFNGIKIDGEAARVIREANNLNDFGHFSTPSFYLYFTEILLIYFLKIKLGVGYYFIVIIQLCLNLLALITFYNFLKKLFNSKKLAFIGSAILIFCIPYQIYNCSLYTESIFFSLVIIYSCKLLSLTKFNLRSSLFLFFLMIIIITTRPTGIFILGATTVYLLFELRKRISFWFSLSIFIGLVCLAILMLNFFLNAGTGFDLLLPFKYEHIICDVPTLDKPTNLNIIDSNSLKGILYYLTHNFGQFFRLAFLKSKAFFGLQRSYYSMSHNIYLAIFFYPLYAFFVFTLIKFNKKLPTYFSYNISIVVIFWGSVICSCDEWHSRFFLTTVPFWIIGSLYFFANKKPTEIS